jgi:hypothetical protein
MHVTRVRPRLPLLAVLAVGILAVGGWAVAAIPSSSGKITGCYAKKSGALRVISAGKRCRRTERKLTWSQKGRTGAPGAAGAAGGKGDQGTPGTPGTNATVNGVAAGGDLTGTYPDPTIAAGKVTPGKIATQPGARVTISSAFSVPHNVTTAVPFTVETFDTAALHDNAVATSRLTAPIAGVYEIAGGLVWTANVTGSRTAGLVVNGTTPIAQDRRAANDINTNTASITAQNVSTVYRLAAGDYVELSVIQTSGIPLDATADDRTHLAMQWLGPG